MSNIDKQQRNELPVRSSVRIKVPSQRKRSQGELSTRMTSRVSKTKKAPRLTLKMVSKPVTQPTEQRESSIVVSAGAEAEAFIEQGSEGFHREQDNFPDDDDDIDEGSVTEDEEGSFTFTSTWRAMTGKESLPGARSSIYAPGGITVDNLFSWKIDILTQLHPRQFESSTAKIEATASYERARVADECAQHIETDSDLDQVMNVLQMWHEKWPKKSLSVRIFLHLTEKKDAPNFESDLPTTLPVTQPVQQGRRTATQQQLNSLPSILSTEKDTGNMVPEIVDKWSCTNRSCRNFGYTCWQDRLPDTLDLHVNHYPVTAELLRLWNKEIIIQHSTVENPSSHVVCKLVTWKLQDKKVSGENMSGQQEGGNSTTQLIQTLLINTINDHKRQPPQQAVPTWSPLCTRQDPQKVLTEFFTWLRTRPSWKFTAQIELLESIEYKVVEDGWDIDLLKHIKKQD